MFHYLMDKERHYKSSIFRQKIKNRFIMQVILFILDGVSLKIKLFFVIKSVVHFSIKDLQKLWNYIQLKCIIIYFQEYPWKVVHLQNILLFLLHSELKYLTSEKLISKFNHLLISVSNLLLLSSITINKIAYKAV